MSGDMDNTNKHTNTTQWVDECFAELTPAFEWQPNPDVGLAYLRSYERKAKRRRRAQRAAGLAILITVVLALTVPATRGIARQLLDRFYMTRPEAVRSSTPRLEPQLFIMEYTSPPFIGRFVSSVAEAQQEAGFDPLLPPILVEQVASGLAVLKVSGPIDAH